MNMGICISGIRREEMIIVAIMTLLVAVGIGCAICAAIPREPWEDQEQEEFLNEWRKKHEHKTN